MLQLNLPQIDAKIKEENGKRLIFDPLRSRYVVLTPEEWVRQHFVNYLITERSYPKERIANEVSIKVNATSKRCDTIVYDNYLKPLLIAEYKAPEVPLTEEAFNQIARYNYALTVPYLILSNGMAHYCCNIDYKQMKYTFLQEIPCYGDINN
jgi:hypothetical protein